MSGLQGQCQSQGRVLHSCLTTGNGPCLMENSGWGGVQLGERYTSVLLKAQSSVCRAGEGAGNISNQQHQLHPPGTSCWPMGPICLWSCKLGTH